MADLPLAELERQLAEYVEFRRRRGEYDYRFADALIGHRQVCLQSLIDDHHEMWADRVRALDRIAEAKGISLAGERSLRFALDEVAERERKIRAEQIARHRAQEGVA